MSDLAAPKTVIRYFAPFGVPGIAFEWVELRRPISIFSAGASEGAEVLPLLCRLRLKQVTKVPTPMALHGWQGVNMDALESVKFGGETRGQSCYTEVELVFPAVLDPEMPAMHLSAQILVHVNGAIDFLSAQTGALWAPRLQPEDVAIFEVAHHWPDGSVSGGQTMGFNAQCFRGADSAGSGGGSWWRGGGAVRVAAD